MYVSDRQAKELILNIGQKMAKSGFVTANDGNITVRVGDNTVWATPTGVNKGDMTDETLIKVAIDSGEVLQGTWKPTTELEMHLNVYRTDNEIMSTAHAHPLHLSVLACAGIELDLPSTPAACAIAGRIPVVPFFCSGTKALAESVIPYVKAYNVVNLANHGPLSWGRTPKEAWYRLEDAEASARLALKLLEIGRFRPISTAQVQEIFSFHHIRMSGDATVCAFDKTDNQQAGIPFTQLLNQASEA